MKKISTMILLVSITLTGFAQSVDLRRKIEVDGVAEKEVTPDIINVSVSLKEYMDGKTKVTISQLEAQLQKAVNEADIPKEDFTINNLASYNYIDPKKKAADFLASKQYLIRFHDLKHFNQVLSKIDPKGIQSTSVESYDYSKIADVKRDLKIQALLAAKDKANYLLNSINEKLGSVISIVENGDNNNYAIQPRAVMFANKVLNGDASTPDSDIDIKKIKLNFSVHTVFEIAK